MNVDIDVLTQLVERVVREYYAPPVVAELHTRVVNGAQEDLERMVRQECAVRLPKLVSDSVRRNLDKRLSVTVHAELDRAEGTA